MKDNSRVVAECAVEEGFNSEFDDEIMDDSSEFLDLAEWTIRGLKDGELGIQETLDRLAGYFTSAISPDYSERGVEARSSDHNRTGFPNTPSISQERTVGINSTVHYPSDINMLDRDYILAGYKNCMHEAIRYLVEEENLSLEDPMVVGLTEHLLSHQQNLEYDRLISNTDQNTSLINIIHSGSLTNAVENGQVLNNVQSEHEQCVYNIIYVDPARYQTVSGNEQGQITNISATEGMESPGDENPFSI